MDAGGFFPELDNERDKSWFMMDAMKLVNVEAVGVGDRDLRFGFQYLKQTAKSKRLDLVCANLMDKKTRLPALQPWIVKKVGTVNVGFFGLVSDKVDLGPGRDSLSAADPLLAAKKAVTDIRKKGATVVVLLSQLGKVETEDLVTAVDGIDVAIAGRNVPLLPKTRLIKNTVTLYGGEQGQYVGRTVLTLKPDKSVASGDGETFVLGPEVGEKADVGQIVKAFEDSFNAKQKKLEEERVAKDREKAAASAGASPDRFIGSEMCIRCHPSQGEQWKTTKHSHAWQTLVDEKKDANSDCIPCHVVGYKQAGGFQSGTDTPQLVNVQCESCHGMGTKHEAYAKNRAKVAEAVCTTCHKGDNDPHWSFEAKLPKVTH